MVGTKSRRRLLVLGVHSATEGYPNTLYRLQDLRRSDEFDICEINVPAWQSGGYRLVRRFGLGALRGFIAHARVIGRYLSGEASDYAYIPYPAVFILFLMSFLPRRQRPGRIVADAFISVYDTVVNDRGLLAPNDLRARLLLWIERRAYALADVTVVDTEQSATFFASIFDIAPAKVRAISLSTNEDDLSFAPYQAAVGKCHVLFVGTLVPLHGIETILAAIELLSGRDDIVFKIIGDGQGAPSVERAAKDGKAGFEWDRQWQSSVQLAREIEKSDICLGIFGGGDKAQRVCPFKIYAYMSIGRAIITGQTEWAISADAVSPAPPFATVPVTDARALAAKIVELVDSPKLRESLARNGHEYYRAHLSNQKAMADLRDSLLIK
jgi:glycosyltransferase involved in cell wall biosynthesis